uniref:SB domain-containing protein n=1 Tax=Chlamydomonas euryale TaxID=1486919 RepID=A0A7R9VWB6_9CHLO|mmetsp:Transcript_5374/g.16269  ORF Transcript_5374/g.16269 Transcript_5374/m.16269 type:complete len:195 (+) Transcript_5374:524-1108(+)
MAALRLQLEAADNAYRKQAAEKMEDLLETQRQLSERKQQLASLVNTLKQEREGTEGIVAEMGAKTQQLRLWLDANEAKVDAVAGMGKEIDIAKAIVPVDALNEQALNAQAEDLAIEDTILALDRALQTGLTGLTVETYLKQVWQLLVTNLLCSASRCLGCSCGCCGRCVCGHGCGCSGGGGFATCALPKTGRGQ